MTASAASRSSTPKQRSSTASGRVSVGTAALAYDDFQPVVGPTGPIGRIGPMGPVGPRDRSPKHRQATVNPTAAYVHIPFCAHHCSYCDFAVTAGHDHLIELYLEALAVELARLDTPRPVRTLFLGGGTPSHLSVGQLDRLFADLSHWLPAEPGAEVSLEANPDS